MFDHYAYLPYMGIIIDHSEDDAVSSDMTHEDYISMLVVWCMTNI